jgi:hypothetical protein
VDVHARARWAVGRRAAEPRSADAATDARSPSPRHHSPPQTLAPLNSDGEGARGGSAGGGDKPAGILSYAAGPVRCCGAAPHRSVACCAPQRALLAAASEGCSLHGCSLHPAARVLAAPRGARRIPR